MFEGLFENLKEIVLQIFDIIWSIFFDENDGIFWFIVDTMFSLGEWFILQVVELFNFEGLLSGYSGVIEDVMILCSKIDRFVPLHESLELFVMFLSFFVILLTLKLILKLIPGIG